MPSPYTINAWGATQTYKQYDVINGLYIGSTLHPTSAHYYATQDNVGQNPSGIYVYNITSITSAEDLATVYFAQTGSGPSVAPGSIVQVSGTAGNNYTGMAVDGGSGWAQYCVPGFADSAGAAGAIRMSNPAWTTGYAFVPDYTTKLPTENKVITTQLGGGYTQRFSQGLNTYDQRPVFVYRNIDKRMVKAIQDYVGTSEGVWPFEVLMPDQYLSNTPHAKWTAQGVDVTPVSYGRYDCSVQMARVFDI